MTHQIFSDKTPQKDLQAQVAPLSILFDEMQALMAMLPGTFEAQGKPLPTDDEVEETFDNMPV